jgi:MFS family permease
LILVFDKRLLPIILGESLEAYDFFLYGLLSVFIAKTFFTQNTELALTFSFTLFSVAYIARPIGSIIWGHIADKYGRKKVMIGTLSLMAVPAIGMALMPSYESIGVTATILVVFLRFLQGIAFGGESPTIIVSLYEMAPENRKSFYAAFYNPGNLFGYLIGIALVIALTEIIGSDKMQNYGWRFLFGISLIFIAILGYFRKRIIETSELKNVASIPFAETIKKDWLVVIKIVLYLLCTNAILYNLLFHNYLIIYASEFGVKALVAQGFIVLCVILITPFLGLLADKIGKTITTLKIIHALVFFCAAILYSFFLSKSLPIMIVGYAIFAVISSMLCATVPAIIVPQASKTCRVSTIGVAFGLSVIAGSFIPAINEITKRITDNQLSPAFIIMLCAVISFSMLFCLKERLK